jgi:flagellin-like hook-associated protein FlgL
MTIGSISTSAATQTSVAALAAQSRLLQKTEAHLATGKSVNTPSDNAVSYYASQSFLQRANDLSGLKDNLSSSLTTLNSTTDSLSSVSQVVQQLQGITAQALGTTDVTQRAGLASQFNSLLPQLDDLVQDATFNGTNLLNGSSANLSVSLNTDNASGLSVTGVDATANGLGITPVTNNFASTSDITSTNSQLTGALSTLRSTTANFGNNATLIQTNQDFTSNLISNLQSASDNLTQADPDQEAANLLAQQAQTQLSTASLNISGQTKEAVLKLFS